MKQFGEAGGEAVSQVKELWEKHYIRCGDSYVSLGPYAVLRTQGRHLCGISVRSINGGGQIKGGGVAWRR